MKAIVYLFIRTIKTFKLLPMKKITRQLLLFIVCLLLSNMAIHTQELTYEVPLNIQVEASTQIVEGKVISKKSYWDTNRKNIYTVNTVEVYKVFKGDLVNTIDVITYGGSVGLDAQIVTPSLKLNKNDVGIFILKGNTINVPVVNNDYLVYSDLQGFYKYNTFKNLVINPYNVKSGIDDFYGDIEALTGANFKIVTAYDVNKTVRNAQTRNRLTNISNFSPTTVTAGTESVLTINGTGFGATQGTVFFSNADDGGASFVSALDTQIMSWSDTQIQVEVPSNAGTGPIRVEDSGGVANTSAQSLTVSYALINFSSDAINPGVFVAYDTQHINNDFNGGYTWQMFTDFNTNTAANESFTRALNTWRCETGINLSIGAVTTTDASVSDGINVVRFDNGAELESGVLGVCISRFSGCFNGPSDIDWFVTELDIVFNDTTNWEFGPALPSGLEVDFESVAVHELGHGHQLGHVINTSNIMHFAIGSGTSLRTLNTNDIDAGNEVQTTSTTIQACGQLLMTNFDCSTLALSEAELQDSIKLYPNPSNGDVFITNQNFIDLISVEIYDINGRYIMNSPLNAYRLNTIKLSHLSYGMYFVKIITSNGSITKRLIRQ